MDVIPDNSIIEIVLDLEARLNRVFTCFCTVSIFISCSVYHLPTERSYLDITCVSPLTISRTLTTRRLAYPRMGSTELQVT